MSKNICKYLENCNGALLCSGQKGAPRCYCDGQEEKCECDGYKPTDLFGEAFKNILEQSMVEHPAHYNMGNIEVIDAILD